MLIYMHIYYVDIYAYILTCIDFHTRASKICIWQREMEKKTLMEMKYITIWLIKMCIYYIQHCIYNIVYNIYMCNVCIYMYMGYYVVIYYTQHRHIINIPHLHIIYT